MQTKSGKPVEKLEFIKPDIKLESVPVIGEIAKGAESFFGVPIRFAKETYNLGVQLKQVDIGTFSSSKELYQARREVLKQYAFNPDVQTTALIVGTGGLGGTAAKVIYVAGAGLETLQFAQKPSIQGGTEAALFFGLPKIMEGGKFVIGEAKKSYLKSVEPFVENTRSLSPPREIKPVKDILNVNAPTAPYTPQYEAKPIKLENGKVIGVDIGLKEGQQKFTEIFTAPKLRELRTESGAIVSPVKRFEIIQEKQIGLKDILPKKAIEIKILEQSKPSYFDYGIRKETNKVILFGKSEPFKSEKLPEFIKLKTTPSKETKLTEFGFLDINEPIKKSPLYKKISKPFDFEYLREKPSIEKGISIGNQETIILKTPKVEIAKPMQYKKADVFGGDVIFKNAYGVNLGSYMGKQKVTELEYDYSFKGNVKNFLKESNLGFMPSFKDITKEETKPKNKLIPLLNIDFNLDIATTQKPSLKQSQAINPVSDIIFDISPKIDIVNKPATIPKLSQKPEEKIGLLYFPELDIARKTKQRKEETETPSTPLIKFNLDLGTKQKSKKKPSGFDVFVKKKMLKLGKGSYKDIGYQKVNLRSLTEAGAEVLGIEAVSKSAARTFIVKPTGREAEANYKDYELPSLKEKVAPSKSLMGAMVQKVKYAISSREEKQQIPGEAQRQRKAKKGFSFKL